MADDDFQRRSTQEGRQVQDIAKKVLTTSGFSDLRPNEVLKELGVTINFVGKDVQERDWYFDVSGAFTSNRAGLIRTDTMWKTLGRANVLSHAGIERLVLLTTNLPKVGSAGHKAMSAAAESFFDAVEMLTPEGRARLSRYAVAGVDMPLPGMRSAKDVYPSAIVQSRGADLEVRVPMLEVASALPARVTLDVHVMPHRIKVLIPSKDSAGKTIPARKLSAASEKVRQRLSSIAGGCTAVPGVGSWIDPVGGEMFEKVAMVEAYADRPFVDVLEDILSVILDDLAQHTAALIVDEQMITVSRLGP